MPPEVDSHASRRRTDHAVVGVELERRQPRANRDVEGAAGDVEHVARDHEAFHRGAAHTRRVAGRQMVDPCDVAVGKEAAEIALEAVREIEGGMGRLLRVPLVGVHAEHLEDGGHRFVGETPHVAQLAVRPRWRGRRQQRPPRPPVRAGSKHRDVPVSGGAACAGRPSRRRPAASRSAPAADRRRESSRRSTRCGRGRRRRHCWCRRRTSPRPASRA